MMPQNGDLLDRSLTIGVHVTGAVVGPLTQWVSATLAYAAIGGTRTCQSCAAW